VRCNRVVCNTMPIFRKVRSCVTLCVLSNGCESIAGQRTWVGRLLGVVYMGAPYVNRVLDFNLLPETMSNVLSLYI